MKKQLQGSLLLVFATLIWGSTFVAQSVGMDYVGGFTFNAVRSIIGAIVVGALFFFFTLMITSIACLAKCLANCGQ